MKKVFLLFIFLTTICIASKVVYITPNGKKYHSTKNCRSLARSKKIIEINIDQIGYRQPCKICF